MESLSVRVCVMAWKSGTYEYKIQVYDKYTGGISRLYACVISFTNIYNIIYMFLVL